MTIWGFPPKASLMNRVGFRYALKPVSVAWSPFVLGCHHWPRHDARFLYFLKICRLKLGCIWWGRTHAREERGLLMPANIQSICAYRGRKQLREIYQGLSAALSCQDLAECLTVNLRIIA